MKHTQIILTSAALLLTLAACDRCSKQCSECSSKDTTGLQNSARAVTFFENELEFKTNPHLIKKVVEGKVQNVTIVDVRRAEDYAKGHIPGAINVPFDKFSTFEGKEAEFPGLRKDGPNVVYCYEMMCNLAAKAAKKFASVGYPVKEMVGGFEEWKKDNLPIVEG